MSDAGEKLAKRMEHSLGFKASVNYELLVTRDRVVEAVRDELERAAVEADKMLGHNHKLPAAIRKLKE